MASTLIALGKAPLGEAIAVKVKPPSVVPADVVVELSNMFPPAVLRKLGYYLPAVPRGAERGALVVSDIHAVFPFETEKFSLDPQTAAKLRLLAGELKAWLVKNPTGRVLLEGYGGKIDQPSPEYGIALGARRAQSVKDYLLSLGVPADRLSTMSYGEEVPTWVRDAELINGVSLMAPKE